MAESEWHDHRASPLTFRQRADGWHVCPDCGTVLHPNVYRHAAKWCPGYAELWAMDVYVLFGENVHEHEGRAALGTLTAPGADFLPWDEQDCAALGPHKHSGELGCRVDPAMAEVWNESFSPRWTKLQRHCKRQADRFLRRQGWKGSLPSVLLSWREMQKRGVWHRHYLLPWESASEQLWSRAYLAAMEREKGRYWFGHVDRRPRIAAGEKLAKYIAGYTLGGGEKASLAEAALLERGVSGRTFYVHRKLTMSTGVTMRRLRDVRRLWAVKTRQATWPVKTIAEWEKLLRVALRSIFREYGEAARVLLLDELDAIPAEARAP